MWASSWEEQPFAGASAAASWSLWALAQIVKAPTGILETGIPGPG
jgi:hypothetical protein